MFLVSQARRILRGKWWTNGQHESPPLPSQPVPPQHLQQRNCLERTIRSKTFEKVRPMFELKIVSARGSDKNYAPRHLYGIFRFRVRPAKSHATDTWRRQPLILGNFCFHTFTYCSNYKWRVSNVHLWEYKKTCNVFYTFNYSCIATHPITRSNYLATPC